LEYRLHDSLITFHFRENGISREEKATLLYQDPNGLTGQSKEVELPYAEKINPGIYQYKLICKGLSETLRPELWDAGISLKEERSHEEVMLRVNNPRNIPFAWFLYKNDKEVANGEGTEFYLKEPASSNDNYLLSIHYLWAGKMSWLRQNSVFQPGQLTIEVDQPERVFPGQKATIEIDVKDAWGKPATDLDLTAFAWTKKFNENPPTIQGTIHRWHDISTFNAFTAGRQQNKMNLYAARKSGVLVFRSGFGYHALFSIPLPGKRLFYHYG
jgi:alpha-2-macroglobulin